MACGFYLSETVTLKENMSTWLLPGGDQVSNYWVFKKKTNEQVWSIGEHTSEGGFHSVVLVPRLGGRSPES